MTDSVDDSILRHNVSKPLPLGGPPGQVTTQSDFFFNKDLEYLRYGSKGSRLALSISKMKEAYYPDVGLEQMVPNQMWIEEECKYDIASIAVRTHMRILSVVRIEVFSMYGYGVQMIMRFNEIQKFSDGTLQQINEALDYRVKNSSEDGNSARANIKQALVNELTGAFGKPFELKDLQHSFCNSDACCYVQEKYGHAGPKVTTSQEGNTPQHDD
nr:hypothetical protein [Tanacetum cinerariifolium]